MIIFGVIGSIVGGIYLKKNKNFKQFIMICVLMSATFVVVCQILNLFESIFISMFGVALFGLFAFPITSALYEYACEIVFPVVIL